MAATIVALSTPPGRSAIAVLRLSGPGAALALLALGIEQVKPRRAARRLLRDSEGQVLDEALVLWFPAPGSYTGEDIAELHLHGSRAIIRRVLDMLLTLDGVRLAEPGEFTRRAVDAGKIDLTAAEALGDLIDSDTEQQRRQAMRALGGGLRSEVERLRLKLIDSAAFLAAAVDFGDEDDVPQEVLAGCGAALEDVKARIRRLLDSAEGAEIVRDGVIVAILGPPNAGKSSLLNALAGRDAAIVSPVAGTTRDRIEIAIDLQGYAVRLVDTAGLRESTDAIERIGIGRSLEAAADCHIALWLCPSGAVMDPVPAGLLDKVLPVRTKVDLEQGQVGGDTGGVPVSVMLEGGLEALRGALLARIAELTETVGSVVVHRERQRVMLAAAEAACRRGLALPDAHPELLAEEIRQASMCLEGLLGRVGVEDVLDAVFSRFCIGK